MKKSTKAVGLILAAVLLIGATVLFTLAYLSSESDVVTNTFTVGKVNIKLDEAKTDEYGQVLDDFPDRVDGNKYLLIPGHEYAKDPTVTVLEDSEACYVRMFLSINLADFFDSNECFKGQGLLPFFGEYDEDVWLYKGYTKADDVRTYEFWYHEPVQKADPAKDQELDPLFETLKIPGDLNEDELDILKDLKIELIAHAIQADGFTDAAYAWKNW